MSSMCLIEVKFGNLKIFTLVVTVNNKEKTREERSLLKGLE